MRGRHPFGPEHVAQLAGSDQARARLRTVLETIGGACRVSEACERLGISADRFEQLRHTALTAALHALEPRAAGRPPHTPPATDELRQLRARIAELEAELQAALIRVELAVSLPQAGAADQKKTPVPPRRRRRQ